MTLPETDMLRSFLGVSIWRFNARGVYSDRSGHVFGEDLVCNHYGCKQDWKSHQVKPRPCLAIALLKSNNARSASPRFMYGVARSMDNGLSVHGARERYRISAPLLDAVIDWVDEKRGVS